MASEKMITLYYADSEAKISLLPYALALCLLYTSVGRKKPS